DQEDGQAGGQDDHADRRRLAPGRGPEGGGGGGADADDGKGAQADRQIVHRLPVGGGRPGGDIHDKLPCRCDKLTLPTQRSASSDFYIMTSRFSVKSKLALKIKDPVGFLDAHRAAIYAEVALQAVQAHQGDGAAVGAGHDLAGAKLAVQHLGAAFGGGAVEGDGHHAV